MKSIEWLASFETGNSDIDDQHRELLDCLDELKDLMESGEGEKAHAHCVILRKLFDSHCADEEALLREAGFPRVDAHMETHEESKDSINAVICSCGKACKGNIGGACIEDLSSILIRHFLQGDMDFKSFLQVSGLAKNNH